MKKKYYYWGDYDLDGAFFFYKTESNEGKFRVYCHRLGPYETLKEAKEEVIKALIFCKTELQDSINLLKSTKLKRIRFEEEN